MAYFIFTNDSDNIEGTLYRIAENLSDLNNLNIDQNFYKIISDTQENFNSIKFGTKIILKYNDNIIFFTDQNISLDKNKLKNYIEQFKKGIKSFTDNNPNHSLFNIWNNYYNQLNNLNLDSITYPLNKSLEQYFKDLDQPSLNPLQLP
jgi:hypothetical protein